MEPERKSVAVEIPGPLIGKYGSLNKHDRMVVLGLKGFDLGKLLGHTQTSELSGDVLQVSPEP